MKSKIITQIIIDSNRSAYNDINDSNFKELLLLASQNRILFQFIRKLKINKDFYFSTSENNRSIINDIYNDGVKKLEAFKKTLIDLKKIFSENNCDLLIPKTFKFYDYVTFDVDILVRYNDFNKAIQILSKNGYSVMSHPGKKTQGLHQRNCFKPGMLKVDLHRKFYWLGIEHIDENVTWINTKQQKFFEETFLNTPSLEIDFILNAKQLMFERRYITLLDFLALRESLKYDFNYKLVVNKISEFRWENIFKLLIPYLVFLDEKIYKKDSLFRNFYKKEFKKIHKKFNLPLSLSFFDDMKTFILIFSKHKKIPYIHIAHYFYSWSRFYMTSRYPFYDHWYDFSKIIKNKKIYTGKVIN